MAKWGGLIGDYLQVSSVGEHSNTKGLILVSLQEACLHFPTTLSITNITDEAKIFPSTKG
jgi:hypothetical protein